jgi:hypothetical protein
MDKRDKLQETWLQRASLLIDTVLCIMKIPEVSLAKENGKESAKQKCG